MSQDFGQILKQKMISSNRGILEYFEGCSGAEIEIIKQAQKVERLPEIYIQFLLTMGKTAGGIVFRGSDYSYQYLLNLKRWAMELIEENDVSIQLPNDAFIFFMHQGYNFHFFHTNLGDDPSVYYFHDGERDFSLSAESLSDWYEKFIFHS